MSNNVKSLLCTVFLVISLTGCTPPKAKCSDKEVIDLVIKDWGNFYTSLLGSEISSEVEVKVLNPTTQSINKNTGEMICTFDVKSIPSENFKKQFPDGKESLETAKYSLQNLDGGKFQIKKVE